LAPFGEPSSWGGWGLPEGTCAFGREVARSSAGWKGIKITIYVFVDILRAIIVVNIFKNGC
jgi:hypothetical protein